MNETTDEVPLVNSPVDRLVKLRCPIEGCTATLEIKFDSTMPKNTAIIESKCPLHQSDDRGSESYFDADGNQILVI